jgi:membrane protease YdiL (CAAX protease family)
MTDYLALARRGRTDWWRYVLTAALALFAWVAIIVMAFIPAFIARVIPADFGKFAMDPAHPTFFFSFAGGVFGVLVVTWALAARLIHGKRFMDIVGPWRWGQFATGAGLWLVLCAAGAGVDYLVRPSEFHLTLGPQTLALALVAVPMLAIQTFCEEFIFRGYATQGLALVFKRPVAAASVSAAIFASLHIPNGGPEAANALVFGFITALIVMRTTNLAFTYGIHVVNNVFGAVVVVSSSDVLHGSPGVLTQSSSDLLWLDVASGIVAFAIAWLWVSRTMPKAASVPEIFA